MTDVGDRSYATAPVPRGKAFHSLPGARAVIAAVFSVAIAVLVLTGTSAAAPVQSAGSVKFTAPYGGYGLGAASTNVIGCGGRGALPVAPSFDPSSGVGIEWAKAQAGSCGSNSNSYSINAFAGVESTNLTGIGGEQNLTIHATLSFYANMSAHGSGASASFLVFPQLTLYDLTNDTAYLGSAGGISYQISVGSYAHEFNDVKFLGFLHLGFKRSHVYYWEVDFVVVVAASISASHSGAISWVDMGAHGQRAVLNSVVIH
jgi:hypothetical protein